MWLYLSLGSRPLKLPQTPPYFGIKMHKNLACGTSTCPLTSSFKAALKLEDAGAASGALTTASAASRPQTWAYSSPGGLTSSPAGRDLSLGEKI